MREFLPRKCSSSLFLVLSIGTLSFIPFQGLAKNCQTLKKEQKLQLYQCDNLSVLVLNGPPNERAKSYGSLVKAGTLHLDTMRYFSNRLYDPIKFGPLRFLIRMLNNLGVKFLHKNVPSAWTEELEILARASGIGLLGLQRGISLPDIHCYLNAYSANWLFRQLPPLGCTSVARKTPNQSFFIWQKS